MTTFRYDDLSKRQRQFVDALAAQTQNPNVDRQYLLDIIEATDIYTVPPAWIVQDSRRRTDTRGVYHVPEIREAVHTIPAAAAAEPVAAPAAAPATVAAAPTMNLAGAAVMGMTGGDRAHLIPNRESTYVPWGHFSSIEKILKAKIFYPTFVTGLSGNGKTTMIEQVCAKLKRPCYRVNITKQTDEDDLLGGFRLIDGNTVWCDGPVVKAMEDPAGGVLLLDEIDLGSTNIMCLQSVLEGKGVYLKKIGRWVTPAAGFTVLATANTKGKGSDDGRFIGTNVMNEAFLDRFPVTLEQEYASRSTEKKILNKAMAAVNVDDADFGDHLVKWAEIIRKSFAEGAVDEIISTRRLVDIVKAYAIFDDKMTAINMAIARFDDDTKEGFLNLYTKVDGDDVATTEAAPTDWSSMDPDARIDLNVSYDQKDVAKSLGCRWDGDKRTWYTHAGEIASRSELLQFNPVAPTEDVECPF